MKKHAYLILAHNEFPVLQRLISALDDCRNDIFIHFDKKILSFPALKTQNAKLHLLTNRVDVRWGDVSVIEAEYSLFESALEKGKYAYYHLLSGVDMPLRSQNEIHDFFEEHKGKEFIGFSTGVIQQEIDRKVNRYHLFPRHFRDTGGITSFFKRSMRYVVLHLQYLFGIRRNKAINFKKGTQWVSITHDFVNYVLQQKEQTLKHYSNTFCSDEIFLQTLCWNSKFKENVFDINNEGKGSQRKIGWKDGVLYDWKEDDFDEIMKSDSLFARKFNSKHLDVVKKLYEHLQSGSNEKRDDTH